ncbi:MAG: hypothetical protein II998_10385 [Clostridia bacterium]|nr:hypothetical protein [Clostridia bacterium]
MKKTLSLFLTLAIVISCIASMSINVSAHQNLNDYFNFEGCEPSAFEANEVAEGGNTLYTTPQSVRISEPTHKYRGITVDTAPDARYGDSLKAYILQDWGDDAMEAGLAGQYLETQYYSEYKKWTGSVNFGISIYMEKVQEDSQYATRSIRFKGRNSADTGNTTVIPLLFDTAKNINFFSTDTGVDWEFDRWYDFDLYYNLDTGYYEATIYENGEILYSGSKATTYTMLNLNIIDLFCNHPIQNIQGITTSTQTSASKMGDWITYFDNIKVVSVNKVEPDANDTRDFFDFEGFEGQEARADGKTVGMPAGKYGYWSVGYTGAKLQNAIAEDVKADSRWEKNIDMGTSLKFSTPAVPVLGEGESYPNGATKNDYQYPRLYMYFNSAAPKNFNMSFDVKLDNPNNFLVHMGVNENFLGLTGSSISVYNTKLSTAINNYDWFNVDASVDGATGWYKIIVTNLTSPSNPPVVLEGYHASVLKWDGKKTWVRFQMNTPGTRNYENYCYIDNFSLGKAIDREIPANFSHNFDDGTVPGWYTATGAIITAADGEMKVATAQDAAGTTTLALPFAYTNLGFKYSADITFEDFNTAKTLSFDDTVFASIDTAGVATIGDQTVALNANEKYTIEVDAINGETTTATVKIAGLETTVTPTSNIKIASAAGESVVAIDNVIYNIVRSFEVVSDEAMVINPEDDIKITFSNPLAESVTAESFKVYAPNGAIADSALVSDVECTISEDRKTVTLSFAKEYTTHYHTAFTVADIYGYELTDVVEADTAAVAELGDVEIVKGDGVVNASFTSTANEGTIFYAIALYEGNELAAIGSKNVTLSLEDVNNDYTVSVEIPDTSKSYTAKVFRWVRNNIAPYQGAAMAESVISAE